MIEFHHLFQIYWKFIDLDLFLNMQLFFNAKSEEIIKIYLPAQPATKIYNLLSQLDPSRIKEYNKLK